MIASVRHFELMWLVHHYNYTKRPSGPGAMRGGCIRRLYHTVHLLGNKDFHIMLDKSLRNIIIVIFSINIFITANAAVDIVSVIVLLHCLPSDGFENEVNQ